MKISWVVSDNIVLDPTLDITKIKDIGPIWGSWRTWRNCSTDNVICYDKEKAVDLLERQFQTLCNLYLPDSSYQFLNRPTGVKLFGGDFTQDISNKDELVALHLAASTSEIVLLLGFNWTLQPKLEDRLEEHKAYVRRQLLKHAISDNPNTQWVLIDHKLDLMPELSNISNLTQDTLKNVLSMLSS